MVKQGDAGLGGLGEGVGSHPAGRRPRPARCTCTWPPGRSTPPQQHGHLHFRQVSQPARLQHVLAGAGVPARVRWGKICLARGRHVLLPTEGFVKFSWVKGKTSRNRSSRCLARAASAIGRGPSPPPRSLMCTIPAQRHTPRPRSAHRHPGRVGVRPQSLRPPPAPDL